MRWTLANSARNCLQPAATVPGVKKMLSGFACVALPLILACHEDMNAYYATAADAEAQGAFSRGWLPDLLNPYAREIREFHDLDSNHGGATFEYAGDLEDRLKHDCVEVQGSGKVASPFNAWTAESADQLNRQGIHAYSCGIFTLVINTGNRLGYLWH